jgi:hypothetical protein
MADAVNSNAGYPRVIPELSVSLGGPTGPRGASAGPHMAVGISEDTAQGFPSVPCIKLSQPGRWRFFQAVNAGFQTLSVYCKQVADSAPYPSMVILANSAIGIAADIEASGGAGADWKLIAQAIVPASDGIIVVELRNNLALSLAPCWFDNFGIS